ncbi:MAG: 3-oxoacyl-[acyl-carrier-protein] reductase [Gemmatimonadota bacterium]
MDELVTELSGQVALVTGGSRGIGLAVARSLAHAGARIAVVGRNGTRAEEAAADLPGTGHAGFACDVAQSSQVQDLIVGVEERVGPVDIVVNNAGLTRDNLLIRMKEEEWDEVLSVNLKGAFNITKAVAKGMMKRRSGAIVNISSVVGLMGNAGQANYAASKAGLLGFTRSVARELGSRGIRCNAVAPGYIETDMTADLGEGAAESLRERIPMGRLGQPEDIAGTVRFLVGPWAGYITGQVVTVDGGMVM